MRIAIISDSHGNLTALDSVLADLDRTGPYEHVLMGGDVAYGGPHPSECISRIRERGYPAVRGNTDQMIVDAVTGNGDAQGEWVVDQLDEASIQYLRTLPVQQQIEAGERRTLGLVHATPWSIYESIGPADTDLVFRRMLFEAGTNVLVYGHIHLQHERTLESGLVVAVGSLGLPFDGDRRAMYTVVEAGSGGWSVDFRRLEYDVEKAISEARKSEVPNGDVFAHNLATAVRP